MIVDEFVAVLHILSNFCETKDWRQSLLGVIPMRKSDPEFVAAKQARKQFRQTSGEGEGGEEDGGSGDDAGDDTKAGSVVVPPSAETPAVTVKEDAPAASVEAAPEP